MPKTSSFDEQQLPVASGPKVQSVVPVSVHGLPTTVASGNTITSNLILADGFEKISAAIISTGAGNFNIQRYLDDAGTLTQQSASSVAVTANAQGTVNITDGLPFSSFKVSFQNTAGVPVTISSLFVMLQ